MKYLPLLLLCATCYAETALDRLRTSADAYLAATAGHEAELRRLEKRLAQKMLDSKMSEDAAVGAMALDFIADERKALKSDPATLPDSDRIKLVARAAFYLRRGVILKGWEEYTAEIERWAAWLQEKRP